MSDDMETMTLGGFDVEIEPSGKTEELDIYNCLLTLYGSKEGEQALDREFARRSCTGDAHGRDHSQNKEVRAAGGSAGSGV